MRRLQNPFKELIKAVYTNVAAPAIKGFDAGRKERVQNLYVEYKKFLKKESSSFPAHEDIMGMLEAHFAWEKSMREAISKANFKKGAASV